MYKGIAASNGFAIGKAYLITKKEISISQTKAESSDNELEKLKNAIVVATSQLEEICEKTKKDIGEEEAKVFESHIMMLDDPEFINLIKKNIVEDGYQVSYAIKKATDFFVSFLEGMDNEYMKARAADVKDVSDRIIRICLGEQGQKLELPNDAIVIADDLTPSDTAQLDKNKVKAFVTQVGSKTSHSAIMARSIGIPAVLGVLGICENIKEGSTLIVDGFTGEIHVNPNQELINTYEERIIKYNESKEQLKAYKDVELEYIDGRKIAVAGNIGSVDDLDTLCEQGAHGVGLFRTEFLFMGRNDMPSEDEQFEVYKTVAERMKGQPVVIRTLDIGGDKVIPYMNMPKEDNPFLGLRALRLCFCEQEVFKTQLKAILRAAVYGNLYIMFPMIGSMGELFEAKKILEQCKKELNDIYVPYKEEIPVGMMIEIPAAAIQSADFAKEVDFFSIGTNDLVQYTLAVDRMNSEVAHLYDPFHPAVLNLIKMTINSAHKAGIWCGMCGEMASDIKATAILASFGLDEFSVTGSAVLEIKEQLMKQDCVRESK